jgi:hypothetical protein
MTKKRQRDSKKEKRESGTGTDRSEDDDGPITVHIPADSFPVQAVEAITHYCYKGYLDEAVLLGDGAEAILKLAHHYEMVYLVKVLEAYLVKSLNSGNAVRRAMLADECSAGKLKKACVSCIAANKSAFKTSELEDLLEKKLKLTVGLLIRVLFHDDNDKPHALECLSREDMVEKRNRNIYNEVGGAGGKDIHDCLFKVGKKTFGCHKCFLVAHSPTLFEFLTSPMSLEAETGVVHEKLFPVPDAVDALLRYCYNGDYASKVGNETVATVFQLTGEYGMDELKSAMEKCLVKNLSTASVVEMAALADAHAGQGLRKACVELIAGEKSVIESAEWVKLEKKNPNLTNELLKGALKEKSA